MEVIHGRWGGLEIASEHIRYSWLLKCMLLLRKFKWPLKRLRGSFYCACKFKCEIPSLELLKQWRLPGATQTTFKQNTLRFSGNGCVGWNGSQPYLISAVPLYFCHLHRRESVYRQGDRRIFSRWRPWRCPQKNKLSKRQSDGSQVAYFRDLLIPRWQERASDVPLASVLFGSGLVSLPSGGERGGMRVRSMWLRNESPKKVFFFLPPHRSTGTLLQQQLFKVLWYFSPLMFIFFIIIFRLLDVKS